MKDETLIAWLENPSMHLGAADRGLIAHRLRGLRAALESAEERLVRIYQIAGDESAWEALREPSLLRPEGDS